MALSLYALNIIKNQVKCESDLPKMMMLSCHDVIAKPKDIASTLKLDQKDLIIRSDSNEIVNWHKVEKLTTEIVNTKSLFELMGFQFSCIDRVQTRGCEDIQDLNLPILKDYYAQYDFVYDGILNQCFNIVQALFNIVRMVKLNGYVIHVTPVLMINNGFYNICPTFFQDFYHENGFEIIQHNMFENIHLPRNIQNLNYTNQSRLRNISDDSMQLILAKRKTIRGLNFPIQSKFKQNPLSKIK